MEGLISANFLLDAESGSHWTHMKRHCFCVRANSIIIVLLPPHDSYNVASSNMSISRYIKNIQSNKQASNVPSLLKSSKRHFHWLTDCIYTQKSQFHILLHRTGPFSSLDKRRFLLCRRQSSDTTIPSRPRFQCQRQRGCSRCRWGFNGGECGRRLFFARSNFRTNSFFPHLLT